MKLFVVTFVMQKMIQNYVYTQHFSSARFSYNDECDGYYYFNTKTKARQWEHPLDAEYKRLVEKARKFGATGVNDLSDVMQFSPKSNFNMMTSFNLNSSKKNIKINLKLFCSFRTYHKLIRASKVCRVTIRI